jgi:hypothetical protein
VAKTDPEVTIVKTLIKKRQHHREFTAIKFKDSAALKTALKKGYLEEGSEPGTYRVTGTGTAAVRAAGG